MSPQTAPPKGSIFTLVAFVRNPLTIKVIFAMIIIHHFLQFDASSFAASVRPTKNNLIKNTFLNSWLILFKVQGRGEYFSKNQYFFTTTKNGPARDSRDTLSLVSLDSNISARTQKKGNFSAHGSNISART